MNLASHWKRALPFYLLASLRFSAIGWTGPLAVALLMSGWTVVTQRRLTISREALALAGIFGAFFFLLSFLTAIAADFHRNLRAEQATVSWDAALIWKVFLYLGACLIFVAAFPAYREGIWVSVSLFCFSIASAIVAKVCF